MDLHTNFRAFKEIRPTKDNCILLTGYTEDDPLTKNPITLKVGLPYLFAMVHQRSARVNNSMSTLEGVKGLHPEEASDLDEVITSIQETNPIAAIEGTSNAPFAFSLYTSLSDAIGAHSLGPLLVQSSSWPSVIQCDIKDNGAIKVLASNSPVDLV